MLQESHRTHGPRHHLPLLAPELSLQHRGDGRQSRHQERHGQTGQLQDMKVPKCDSVTV